MVLFGQSGCISAKVVVIVQKWLYSGKVDVIGQSGFNRSKGVLFGQSGCISAKVVVIVQKWLYSGKVVVFGQISCIR